MKRRMMSPASRGLLRDIEWWCGIMNGRIHLFASLASHAGMTVMFPFDGRLDHDDFLCLQDRITRFFLTIYGSNLFYSEQVKHEY